MRRVSLRRRILTPAPQWRVQSQSGISLKPVWALCMTFSLLLSLSISVRTALALVIKAELERGNPSKWTLNLHPALWLVKGEKWWGGVSTFGWEGGEEVRSAWIYSYFRRFSDLDCFGRAGCSSLTDRPNRSRLKLQWLLNYTFTDSLNICKCLMLYSETVKQCIYAFCVIQNNLHYFPVFTS